MDRRESDFDVNEFQLKENQQRSSGGEMNNPGEQTKLYMIRWRIAAFLCVQIVVIRMLMNSFGIVNNVYREYFCVSYYVVDWFTMIQIPGMLVSTAILAILSFNSVVGFRKLIFIMEFCALLSCALSLLSFIFPRFFVLIFLGQFAIGFGMQASGAIITTFATNWFPENQIGLAISFKSMGMSVGCLMAFLIPSQLVYPPPKFRAHGNSSIANLANYSNVANNWNSDVRLRFSLLYAGLLSICAIVWLFLTIYASDYPPKPPTIAQKLIRQQKNYGQPTQVLNNLGNFFNACKKIWFDTVLFQAVIACASQFSGNYLQTLLMGQIVRDIFIFRNYGSHVNAMSGYVLILYEVGCFFGTLVSARLLDHFKKHKTILCSAVLLNIVSMTGLVLGRFFNSIELIFVFNTILGFGLCACLIPLLDMVLQHTYPTNPAFVTMLFLSQTLVLVLLIGQTCRLILNFISGTAVLVFLLCLLVVGLIAAVFLKPNYKRQNACDKKSTNSEEAFPLLNNDN